MKFTTQGALPRLSAIMLSALVCVACNSDPEPSPEASIPEDAEMAQAPVAEECTIDIPGVEVDFSSSDINGGLLFEFGGPCKLSNAVIASASKVHRTFLNNNYCSQTDIPAGVGRGVMGIALTTVDELVEQDDTVSEELHLAESLCGDESVMDTAVLEFLTSSDLSVYSVGTAEYDNVTCPAVVWLRSSAQQGQSYNVTGFGQCSAIELPHDQLFNPEKNADGQLPGDYIRDVLAYNGALPSHYEYKESTYRFVSDRVLALRDATQGAQAKADRSILGENSKQYIFWSSGDKDVKNNFLSSGEVLTRQYHSDDLKDLPSAERALLALQRSYGEPKIVNIKQVKDGSQPGVHATVATSSGDQFVMILKSSNDASESELADWLPTSFPELLVFQGVDSDGNENLILDGALFTDGSNTFFGQLEACECNSQGALGWLGEERLELTKELEQARKDFIARPRKNAKFKDWSVTSQLGPRTIGYVLSSYDDASREGDAAYVVHGGGTRHTLYAAMDTSCKEESLLFVFGKKSLNVPAKCRKVGTSGVAYTPIDSQTELAAQMRRGSSMRIGLVEPEANKAHEVFLFSLMGATQGLDAVDMAEAEFSDLVVERYADRTLLAGTELSLFERLRKRPVSCRSGESPPGCVSAQGVPVIAAAKPAAPVVAAAKPVKPAKPAARVARRIVRVEEPKDYVPDYADIVTKQLGSSKRPECIAVVSQIMDVAGSSGTSDSRAQQIDLIVGRAPNSCF